MQHLVKVSENQINVNEIAFPLIVEVYQYNAINAQYEWKQRLCKNILKGHLDGQEIYIAQCYAPIYGTKAAQSFKGLIDTLNGNVNEEDKGIPVPYYGEREWRFLDDVKNINVK